MRRVDVVPGEDEYGVSRHCEFGGEVVNGNSLFSQPCKEIPISEFNGSN